MNANVHLVVREVRAPASTYTFTFSVSVPSSLLLHLFVVRTFDWAHTGGIRNKMLVKNIVMNNGSSVKKLR